MASFVAARTLCVFAVWSILIHVVYSQAAWNAYWNKWTKTDMHPRMYPFGTDYKDKDMQASEISGINPKIKFKIPFYGIQYDSVVISYYGHIAFPFMSSLYLPYPWPNQDYPDSPDPPFVAPYYSENTISPRGDKNGDVFWRTLDEREYSAANDKEIVAGMLNEISYQVRAAVVGADLFVAKYGIVVTWSELTFPGIPCANNKCPLNTYQAVLVTDEVETYAVFNYWDITWIGGQSQNCNPNTGKPDSNFPKCRQAVAGFNSGYGRQFTPLPHSGTDAVLNLNEYSGTNITGQFIYSVGGDTVTRGGCLNSTNIQENWALEIAPNFGPQLGGNLINVSGPCFTPRPGLIIKCMFGDQLGVAYLDPNNHMRAYCVAPVLNVRGEVDLKISVDGGNKYDYKATYHVIPLTDDTPKVVLDSKSGDWFAPDSPSLKLSWNPNDLDHDKNVKVDVRLFGYREDNNGGAQWSELHVIKTGIKNGDGTMTFQTKDHRCDDVNKEFYDVGAIQVSVNKDQGEDPANPRRIWSEIIPLGWYLVKAMEKKHGTNWPTAKCNEWKNGDSTPVNWQSELLACPCKYEQAYTNFGQWIPDVECDIAGTNKMCRFHPGARHCVRTAFPTARGSGNQCCYDGHGHLLYSEDSESGSTPDRSHPWGLYPYKISPKVPEMSHWVHDVIAQIHCCRWSSNCRTYLERRLTVDCKGYASPKHATVFGDPHFQTFDGMSYTFNGKGEFWLLKITQLTSQNLNVHLQGRFEQPSKKTWGEVKGTQLTSVVLVQDKSHPVQIQVHQNQSVAARKLSVFVDSQEREFNHETRRRDFSDGKIVIIDASPAGHRQTNFTVILNSGVSIRVASLGDYMNVIAEVTQDAKGKTDGLFGRFDGDSTNDLMPKNSKSPVTSTNTEVIHNSFGLTWAVSKQESDFMYHAKMDWDYFQQANFTPNFQPRPPIPSNASFTEADVQKLCVNNNFCQFDYRVTGEKTTANSTLHANKWFIQIQDHMSKPVNSCGILPVTNAIRNTTNGYLVGSVVTLKGCSCACTLQGGKTRFTCVQQADGSGKWSPSVSGVTCTPNSELGRRSAMAAAIAVPIVLVFLIVIVVIAAVIIFRKKKQEKEQQAASNKKPGNETETAVTDTKKPYSYPRPDMNPDPVAKTKSAPAETDYQTAQYVNSAVSPDDIAMEAAVAREVALEAAARREMALTEAAKRELELDEAARREAELAVAARLAHEHINSSRRNSKDSAV